MLHRVIFIKFPLTIHGIEHTAAKYINITGVLLPLTITIGHTFEYFVQTKHTFSPIYTYMRNQGGNAIPVVIFKSWGKKLGIIFFHVKFSNFMIN